MKLLIMQFSPSSCHFISLWSKDLETFRKDWFSLSNLAGGNTDTQTPRQHGDGINVVLFFINKGSMLKIITSILHVKWI
jgi:hypothetical protein